MEVPVFSLIDELSAHFLSIGYKHAVKAVEYMYCTNEAASFGLVVMLN